MRPVIAMFDLENTIIDSWDSRVSLLYKINFINNWLNDFNDSHNINISDYGIFSFAVDNEFEKPQAIDILIDTMHIKCDIKWVPSWKDLENILRFRADIQKWELVDLFGKDRMFPIYAAQFPDCDFILFDDTLAFKDQIIMRDGQMLRMIRV